ncbi:MAG: hypothetical protein V1918_03055, partial [Planctomycetota bacterium]
EARVRALEAVSVDVRWFHADLWAESPRLELIHPAPEPRKPLAPPATGESEETTEETAKEAM